MVVYHGGAFKRKEGKISYVGGKCEFIKEYDVMGIMDFWVLKNRLGYPNNDDSWYLVPNESLENGLVRILDNDSVVRMNIVLGNDRRINVYIESCEIHMPILDEVGPSNVGADVDFDSEADQLYYNNESGAEEEFDDNFVELEYQQLLEPEPKEGFDGFVHDDEEEIQGSNEEEKNSGSENDESKLDEEQKKALRGN